MRRESLVNESRLFLGVYITLYDGTFVNSLVRFETLLSPSSKRESFIQNNCQTSDKDMG